MKNNVILHIILHLIWVVEFSRWVFSKICLPITTNIYTISFARQYYRNDNLTTTVICHRNKRSRRGWGWSILISPPPARTPVLIDLTHWDKNRRCTYRHVLYTCQIRALNEVKINFPTLRPALIVFLF